MGLREKALRLISSWNEKLRAKRTPPPQRGFSHSTPAPVVYIDPEEQKRREGETYDQYCQRVPLYFQPVDAVKLSYRGKPL
jgi:hypothetical protein